MTFLKFLGFCVFFILVLRFCHWQTDGFTLSKIHSESVFEKKWETPSPNAEILKILAQKFTYLSCGNTCYVFESEDGKFVLKFFKQHHLYPLSWIGDVPIPKLQKRREKKERVFTSCKLAFDELKEETGLVYLHLNPTHGALPRLTFTDKIGISHTVPLDQLQFLLQKKAENAYSHIQCLLKNHDYIGAKKGIEEILKLMVTISEKGFNDLDPNIGTNLGFIENRPVKIDVGPLVKDTRLQEIVFLEKKKAKALTRLKKWVKLNLPDFFELLERTDDKSLCR
jgi:hypothetical protein